ncbi:hypothetical protein DQ04_00401140 [Trypanosoma grayi]|uniref:hypothetical protein n=1 Tax=Trypanosoma grayi TaxID=71804 RepID=UPI0004F408A9|nr:hypothetical protein DQ04_00401140 [Trypanosoma grayi]KEG14574.1 hypothetical protein DQ04_00401140 [Trypanosoma grayi]
MYKSAAMDSWSHFPDDSVHAPRIGVSESSLIEADEELIRTAGIATLEADCSEREVERWRLEVSAQIQRLSDRRRERELLQKEVTRLEQDLKRITTAAASVPAEGGSANQRESNTRLDTCNPRENELIVFPGTFALATKGSATVKEVELQYFISRTISALDAAQTDVVSLRQQHADLWHRVGELREDISRLKTTYARQEQQKNELLQQKLFLKASGTNPAYRKAIQAKQELEELVHHAAERRAARRQSRMERASMVAHLLEGAVFRERQAHNVYDAVTQRKGYSDHPMYRMLCSLQEENMALRGKYIQLVRGSEEENAALLDYLNVMEERLLVVQGAKNPMVDLAALSPKQL